MSTDRKDNHPAVRPFPQALPHFLVGGRVGGGLD
jgi:hypothetical protein